MSEEIRPWKLSFSHPLASVLVEQQKFPALDGLAPPGSEVSSPQKITATVVTDHPVLNELIQVGIALLGVALPLVVGGLFGEPSPAAKKP